RPPAGRRTPIIDRNGALRQALGPSRHIGDSPSREQEVEWAMLATSPHENAWRRRLFLPHYQVQEAAKYADIDAGTVIRWQKSAMGEAIAPRQRRVALSYMQLIELAVVAALRKE